VRGFEQAGEYRVRGARRRPELRLVQGAHEKWVVATLDGAHFTGGVSGDNSHPMFAGNVLYRGQ